MLPDNGEAPGAEWFKKDGLHLSPEGYATWTAVVNETLKRAGVFQ
jgi:lysophospholipase L1-like esterase